MSDIVVRIEVTAEDIAKGVRGRCRECPVALAIERVCVAGTEFEVTFSFVAFEGTGRVRLPESASFFICEFETEQPVSPFAFDVSLPREYVKPEFWPAEVNRG